MLAKQLKINLLQVFREADSDKTLVLLMNKHVYLVAVHLTNALF